MSLSAKVGWYEPGEKSHCAVCHLGIGPLDIETAQALIPWADNPAKFEPGEKAHTACLRRLNANQRAALGFP